MGLDPSIIDGIITAAVLGLGGTLFKMWRSQGVILQRLDTFTSEMEGQRKELQRQIKENAKAIANERKMRGEHIEKKLDAILERMVRVETTLEHIERNGK